VTRSTASSEELRRILIKGVGTDSRKKRKSTSVSEATPCKAEEEDVLFDLLVFDSIEDANKPESGRIPGNAKAFKDYCTLNACGMSQNLFERRMYRKGYLVQSINNFLGSSYNFYFLLVNKVNQSRFEYTQSVYGSFNIPGVDDEIRMSIFDRFSTRLFFAIIRTEKVFERNISFNKYNVFMQRTAVINETDIFDLSGDHTNDEVASVEVNQTPVPPSDVKAWGFEDKRTIAIFEDDNEVQPPPSIVSEGQSIGDLVATITVPVGTPYIAPGLAGKEDLEARADCRVITADFVERCAAASEQAVSEIQCGICGKKGFISNNLWNVIISECEEGRYCYFHASCLGHHLVDAYFVDLHVPVLPTGNEFTCRDRFKDLVAKRCPTCGLLLQRAMM